MSTKMFFMSSFGLIPSTSKIEKKYNQLLNTYNQLIEAEQSEELKQFNDLKAFVLSETFAAQKKKTENEIFKGSKEEATLKEWEQLSKNKKLKLFYSTFSSSDLKRYQEIKDSEKLTEFEKIEAYIKNGKLAQETKKQKAETLTKKKNYQQLKSSDDIRFYFRFDKSKAWKNYQQIVDSKERVQFEKLQKLTSSEEYQKNKESYLQDTKKWRQLSKNKKLRLFYSTLNSSDLKRYQKIKDSEKLTEFKELETYIKNGGLVKEIKEQKADALAKKKKYQQLKSSDDIRFYFRFGKSKAWKNYQQMVDSKERKRFEELRTITSSEEFLQRKAYLQDSKKWEKTDEYKQQQQYLELKKNPTILHYQKYKNDHELDFFKNWSLIFSDKFNVHQLDPEKWQTEMYNVPETLGRNYSQPGDLQAFTSGNNIKTDGKKLSIEIRKEKTKGMQWQMPFGFVEKEFAYSSGCISSCGSFWAKEGIWEAKVKYSPSKGIANSLYLQGKENNKLVRLVETGVKNRMGFFVQGKENESNMSVDISGLKSGQYYIFRFEWEAGKMIWKINNKEMLVVKSNLLKEEMHLNAASVVITEIPSGLPSCFELDWIRVWQKK